MGVTDSGVSMSVCPIIDAAWNDETNQQVIDMIALASAQQGANNILSDTSNFWTTHWDGTNTQLACGFGSHQQNLVVDNIQSARVFCRADYSCCDSDVAATETNKMKGICVHDDIRYHEDEQTQKNFNDGTNKYDWNDRCRWKPNNG